MRVDLSRMTAAAIEAALDDGTQQRRPRLSGMRAVAAGAALAVAARAAVKHGPGLPHMPDLSAVPDRVRERLADHGWLPDDEDEHDDEEYEDDGYDDDPEAEGDDDFDDDEDDDVDEEHDDARNGRRTTARARRSAPRLEVPDNGADAGTEVPGVLELLSTRRSRPGVTSRRRRASRVDPAARPPEPPERESDTKTASRR